MRKKNPPLPRHVPLSPEERARRDERLAAAGIRIPNYAGARPMRPPVRPRPKWLAFLIRTLKKLGVPDGVFR
jgi:hypothetical protein